MASRSSLRRRVLTGSGVVVGVTGATVAAATSTMSAAQAAAGGLAGALTALGAGSMLGRAAGRRRDIENAAHRLAAATVALPRTVPRTEGATLSWLLSPDSRVTPFRARGKEMERLLSWCEEDGRVLALCGPEGTGKTRLTVEFAERVAADWAVLRVIDPGALSPRQLLDDLAVLGRPTVVVVDLKTQPVSPGVEGYQRGWIAGLLARVGGADARVKVLIECRSTWWQEVMRQQLGEDAAVLDGSEWLQVSPSGSADDIERWLNEFARAICSELGVPAPKPLQWKHPRRVRMLHLQARAVAIAYGDDDGAAASEGDDAGMAAAARYLFELERASWVPAGLAAAARDDVTERRAVSVLTLLGAGTEEEAAECLRRVPDLTDSDSDRRHSLARKIRTCYPGSSPGEWVGRVESDLIGAALHAEVFSDAFLVQALVEPALTPEQLVRCLRTLVPATATFPALGTVVSAVLGASPLGAVPETLAFAIYLDDLSATDALMADYLAGHPPAPSAIAAIEPLVNPAMFRTRTVLARLRCDAAKDGEAAELLPALYALLFWLERIGRYEEAVRTYEETIVVLRARGSGDWIAMHDIPAALASMAGALSHLGRYSEASVALSEAVPLFRVLAADNVGQRANLAAALCNLSSCLRLLGRTGEAYEASEEAVRLLREIVADDDHPQATNLAAALGSMGNALAEMARIEEARAAYSEGIAISRSLARTSLALHGPGLAVSLRNLCGVLNGHGLFEEARAAGSEAVVILRRLVAENDGIHDAELAAAMGNLSESLDGTTRYDEALALDQERVLLLRRLVATDPEMYLPGLATALRDLGKGLSRVRRVEDSVAALRRSVEIFRELQKPSADMSFQRACALCNLCESLDSAGRPADALPVIEEAVALLRATPDAARARADGALALALYNRSVVLEHVGRTQDAIDGHLEVVRLCDGAAMPRPVRLAEMRAMSSRILRELLPLAGREDDLLTLGLAPATQAGAR